MRLGSCPRLGDSLSVLSSCDVLVPTVHGHLLVLSPKVLCDSLITSSYLTEEVTNVRGGSLSEGRVGRFGLFLLIPPTTPLSPMPSAVLSLWSPIFPAISCPVCLTPSPPPCEEAGAVARWMEACGTGSLLGTFREIWPLAGAHGAGSSVGPRVNLSCTSLNQCLCLWNREGVGSS